MGCHKSNCMLAAINTITVLMGLVLLIFGIIGIVREAEIREYTGGASWEWFVYTLLVVGIIIIAVGVVGWCAGFKANLKLAYIYVGLIVFIIILQFALGLYAYLNRDKIPAKVDEYMESTFSSTNYSALPSKQQETVDLIQEKLSCCGLDGPSSWNESTPLPSSCCKNDDDKDDKDGEDKKDEKSGDDSSNTNDDNSGDISKREADGATEVCTINKAFEDGCREEAKEALSESHTCFVIILLVGFLIEIICAIIGCFVAKNARQKFRYHRTN